MLHSENLPSIFHLHLHLHWTYSIKRQKQAHRYISKWINKYISNNARIRKERWKVRSAATTFLFHLLFGRSRCSVNGPILQFSWSAPSSFSIQCLLRVADCFLVSSHRTRHPVLGRKIKCCHDSAWRKANLIVIIYLHTASSLAIIHHWRSTQEIMCRKWACVPSGRLTLVVEIPINPECWTNP